MDRKITYRNGINEALHQEMERDDNVFIYGLDVDDHKQIFDSHTGLLNRFGSQRVFSTPLSESALMGFGLGAAIKGLRPINVHIRVDFLILAMNQLANMVASYSYGSGGSLKVPLTIRAVIGRGWGQSYQHSKSLQSIFAHIPGLKVVMPTTARDAKNMLVAAIRDDNPVIVLEHRWLYDAEGNVPEEYETTSLSGSQVLRQGSDLTIIGTSWMNVEALKAADVLSRKAGIEIEVIDARSISPFDEMLSVESTLKTGHCIVADLDWLHCGFSAEIATRIYEKCLGSLKSPIRRIGFAETHCPCARPLEDAFYPNAITLIRAIEEELNLSETDLSGEDFYSYENKFRGPF